MGILFWVFASLFLLGAIISSFYAFIEKEPRALRISLLMLLCVLLFFPGGYYIGIPEIILVVNLLIIISLSYLFVPFRFSKTIKLKVGESFRFDERDMMFSRMRLEEGTKRFDNYYNNKPDNKRKDDEWRKEAGLMSNKSRFYKPFTFAAAEASFQAVNAFHPMVSSVAQKNHQAHDAAKTTLFIEKWLKSIGAKHIGFTTIKPYHLYTHKGRGEEYGNQVKNTHKNAIALTVEMDYDKMKMAPYGPTIMESAQQYLSSGTLATQLAFFIRSMGFDARTHIDGNYELICPLVARDAGIGEIGRMGLLMTPDLGPRVRIAVVSTNMPLIMSTAKDYQYITEFCRYCKKCADVCPSRAIPFDEPKISDGSLRWKIDDVACFNYWCKTGTDCGRCMISCPFAHPNNIFHSLIRSGIQHFPNFARMAVFLDDIFYGRKPHPIKPAGWLDF